uniref:Uncharacterized protein n=1 Tax=Glossina palpalis gambiensis TaxID=67801 RepID=A0A1B0B4F8_9MUSC
MTDILDDVHDSSIEHSSSMYLRSAERRKVPGLPMIISNDLARDSMTLRRCAKVIEKCFLQINE